MRIEPTGIEAMRVKKAARRLFAAALSSLLGLPLLSDEARAQDPPAAPIQRVVVGDAVSIVAPTSDLEVIERGAKNVEFKEWVTRVDGFDPKVIDVKALNQQVLRVQGLEQGVTTMTVTDKSGRTFSIEVYVTGDARLLQTVLNKAFPNSAIQATMLKGMRSCFAVGSLKRSRLPVSLNSPNSTGLKSSIRSALVALKKFSFA
jgi:Flp pilus assembly secretin CpaC